MVNLLPFSLQHTAQRVENGTPQTIAIKEHIDAWNKTHDNALFYTEPALLTGDAGWLNAWLAGAAEFESFLINTPPPEWTIHPSRFLKSPYVVGGAYGRQYALIETPFAWRRRLLFSGRTSLY